MEKMMAGRSERRAYLAFLNAWRAAGYPKNFRWSPQTGRIWDKESARERLLDRIRPERVSERGIRGELRYKKKTNDLYYG